MASRRKAWAVMAVVFLSSIAVSFNRFKVPPVMQVLMADLDVSMTTGGWLMSSVMIASLVLIIPSAFLLQRLGLKRTGLVALSFSVAGATIGAFSTGTTMLLVARVVEGTSFALMAVVAPAALTAWFPPRERGLPMGVWAAWVPVGIVLAFNVAPTLEAWLGWRAVWWLGACLALVAMVLYGLVVHDPAAATPEEDGPTLPWTAPAPASRVLVNPTVWLYGLAFAALAFSTLAYSTWAPTFLADTFSVGAATASFYASLMFMAAIPANIGAGALIDRARNRHLLLVLFFLITTILFVWSFRLGSVAAVVPYLILLGFVSNLIPASIFTLAPDTVQELRHAGLALAVVTTGSQIGSLSGPPALGAVVDGGDWATGNALLVAVMAAGTLFIFLGWRRLRAATKHRIPEGQAEL